MSVNTLIDVHCYLAIDRDTPVDCANQRNSRTGQSIDNNLENRVRAKASESKKTYVAKYEIAIASNLTWREEDRIREVVRAHNHHKIAA